MTDRATRTAPGARCALVIASVLFAFPLQAQQPDTTRVTYRTRDIVFVAAGRGERLAVGDTLQVTTGQGAVAAVVLSIAQHTASARLLRPAQVADGAAVTWQRRPEAASGIVPPPALRDANPAAAPAGGAPPRLPPPPPAPRRLSATVQLEQLGSGGGARLGTSQTVGLVSLRATPARGVELRLRTTARRRGGASASLSGAREYEATVYQAELALGGPRDRWAVALGRFVPPGAMALGYLDGLRVEWRPAPAHAIGAAAGLVPSVVRLSPSGATRRAGAWWRFGTGRALSGSLAAAADWAAGARRRSQLASQGFWAPPGPWSLSWYADADLGAPWDSAGAHITNLFATLRVRLPAGVRSSIGIETHRAVRLWETALTGDTLPLPGRLTGVSASLGRDLLGFALDASGARLGRAGDPTATLRGSLTASRRGLFLSGSRQHGDLLTYSSFMARASLPRRLPVNASLGLLVTSTDLSGGASLRRVSVRPELSGSLRGGWFWSAGGDVGRYAGTTTSWLHAGVSYRFDR